MKLDKRILLVDDSTTNNILLQNIFEDEGYTVDVAFNAKEAYKLIDKNRPDIILLDIMMPEIDGLKILETINSDTNTNSVPVIMVTARDDEETHQNAIKQGAVDYIRKPIDVEAIIEKVKAILN